MKPLSVAVICADLNPKDLGGAEVHIVEVIRELAARGHRLHVFVGNDDSAKVLFDENVTVHPVHYRRRRNFNSMAFVKAAVRHIPKCGVSFDLLHAKQVYPQAIAGAKLKRKLGLPLYVTVQNPLAYKEELVLTGFLKFILSPFLWVLGQQCKKALRAADICGCVSEYSETHAQKMGARHTVRVPNGIALDKFKLYEGKRHLFEIVTTSTLIPRNGIDTLIESLPAVIREFPKTHLKIAGEGPLRADLDQRIAELKLKDHVEFLGTLPHTEIPKLVREAHVFVRPSRFEGFGVSFIEAMALGTPVVTCPVGGIPDFLTDGETGMLVPPNHPDDLSRAIRFVFENPDNVAAITQKARALVEDRYDWKRIADAVEGAYNRCLNTDSNL